jgi:transposase
VKNITTIGIDLAKNIFQIHGVDAKGKVVLQKRVTRSKLMETMSKVPPCLVGIEACGGSNYWYRELKSLGHDVKIMSPQHVKPYIGSTKNDYKDAAGICEAVSRPKMLFVPHKTKDQQDIQSIHRVRSRLVAERTALVNQIRGLLAEYGVILAKGIHQVRNQLLLIIENGANELTPIMREMMEELHDELILIDQRIKRYDTRLEGIYKTNEGCKKIGKIGGIGPISATAIIAAVGDAKVFKNGRQMAAWLGLTPKQHSSGEKQRLFGISKRGDNYVRYLLVHGARSVVKYCHQKQDAKSRWLDDKVIRRGKNKAAVALANKTARTIWALLTKEENYRFSAL